MDEMPNLHAIQRCAVRAVLLSGEKSDSDLP